MIEHALFSAGIPYRVYGGLRYFQRAEIKHAIAYLQLMDNPHNDSAFLRVVNFPTRGIGARSLEHLQDAARQYGISLYAAVPYVTGKAGTLLGAFVKLIEGARFETQQPAAAGNGARGARHERPDPALPDREGRRRPHRKPRAAGQRGDAVRVGRGLRHRCAGHLGPRPQAQAGAAHRRLPDGVEILDADAPLPTVMSPLSAFLSHASLEAGDNQAQAGPGCAAADDGALGQGPGIRRGVHHRAGRGLVPAREQFAQEADGVEEERRLMYVAITRARKRLYMSFSQTRMLHGQTRYNMKSRFFDELPEEALKWLSPRVQHNWFGHAPKAAWDQKAAAGVDAAHNAIAHNFSKKDIGWRIGETVQHQKFGEGVIVNIEGGGGSARAHINFGRHGMKLLDLSIAKLEKVGAGV